MTVQSNSELQQLSENVSRLSEALAASERRRTAMARAIRWSSLAFIALVAGVSYAVSDWIEAYAAADPTVPGTQMERQNSQGQPPNLNDIMLSLMSSRELQGAFVKVMQFAGALATREIDAFRECEIERAAIQDEVERENTLCFSKTKVRDLGEFFLDAEGNLPQPPVEGATPDEQMEYGRRMMESTLMATGQAMVDGAALLHRVRRDSDYFRRTLDDIGGVQELLAGIRHELKLMNGMMASIPVMAVEMGEMDSKMHAIPAMANEMNTMNRQMSVMSHSVGNTMGRMGNIMPW